MWTIIKRTADTGPVEKAMSRLYGALTEQKILWKRSNCEPDDDSNMLFAGLRTDGAIECLTGGACPAEPESIYMSFDGRSNIAAGSDERGLAYVLYELAERVESCGEAVLLSKTEMSISPGLRVRGVDRFISNSGDVVWWMNGDFWRDYLEMMLADRFNRLTVTVGFDTAYLSPPYPFFVKVPGYEGVTISPSLQFNRAEYLKALRQIGTLCHEYGMEFSFAIWQQKPWLGGLDNLVRGLEDVDTLMEYCAEGIQELLKQCPEIDVIQYRVNHESGIGTQVSAENYWLRQIEALAASRDAGREVKLDLRAKGMTDRMTRHAKELGLDVTVSTKFCCEQAGLPYHLTQMRAEELTRPGNLNSERRYSYADMLRKPRTHPLLYRLWNNGSTNLFTWGDPDYVRRFADSMRLGPAVGFEVMPPLSYKGGEESKKDTGWELFDDAQYQPERWEDDRYWLFYRLFGRIGYNLDSDAEAWVRPMQRRFGVASEFVMEAVVQASRIIPFLVSWHFPEHPQEWYWAELSTGAALFKENNYNKHFGRVTYASTMPCDEGMFYSIDEYVRVEAEGAEDGRYTLPQVLAWMKAIAADAAAAMEKAERAGLPDTPEARGVRLDVRMLCALAEYHIYKAQAAYLLSRYRQYGNTSCLSRAVTYMKVSIEKWELLSSWGEAYHNNLLFGVGTEIPRKGTWRDYLPELRADLAMLESMAAEDTADETYVIRDARYTKPPRWRVNLPAQHPGGKPLKVSLLVMEDISICGSVRMRVRHTNQLEGEFRTIPMCRTSDGWSAYIPAEEADPAWDLLLFFETTAVNGDGIRYPGLWNDQELQPYFIIKTTSPQGTC
jgi:hypothetical protein